MLVDALFYIFAIIVIGSAAIVVFSKNILYSAFSLLFTFFGVAGLYVLLNADFIAITQIMVYIGGILVLILFGVMLTQKVVSVDIKTDTMGKFQTAVTGVLMLAVAIALILMLTSANWFIADAPMPDATIKPIGTVLLTDYLIAFEVASVLLLIAIVGAALIARRNK